MRPDRLCEAWPSNYRLFNNNGKRPTHSLLTMVVHLLGVDAFFTVRLLAANENFRAYTHHKAGAFMFGQIAEKFYLVVG